METETSTPASATTALALVRSDRFTAWCTTCQADTEPDDVRDTRWCGVCGTRRD
jgi:hypothetical protein